MPTCPFTTEMTRVGDTRVGLKNFWRIETSEIYEWERGLVVRSSMHQYILNRYPNLELWLDLHSRAHAEVDKYAADSNGESVASFFKSRDLSATREELWLKAGQVFALASLYKADCLERRVHRSHMRQYCTDREFDRLRRLKLVERWTSPLGAQTEAFYSTRLGRMRVRLESRVLEDRTSRAD